MYGPILRDHILFTATFAGQNNVHGLLTGALVSILQSLMPMILIQRNLLVVTKL